MVMYKETLVCSNINIVLSAAPDNRGKYKGNLFYEYRAGKNNRKGKDA